MVTPTVTAAMFSPCRTKIQPKARKARRTVRPSDSFKVISAWTVTVWSWPCWMKLSEADYSWILPFIQSYEETWVREPTRVIQAVSPGRQIRILRCIIHKYQLTMRIIIPKLSIIFITHPAWLATNHNKSPSKWNTGEWKTLEKKPSTERKINKHPETNIRERNRSIVAGNTRAINSTSWGWRNEVRSEIINLIDTMWGKGLIGRNREGYIYKSAYFLKVNNLK